MLGFSYDSFGLLIKITTPTGDIKYAYDGSNRLSSVIFPDGNSETFKYEDANPFNLTSVTDESGNIFSSFSYDSGGKAISTERAGGVFRHQLNYSSDATTEITDPLGTTRTYEYSFNAGRTAVISATLSAGDGRKDAAARVQSSSGLITSENDFKNIVSTTYWDENRRLPKDITRASGLPEAANTLIRWHPTYHLPLLVSESGHDTSANTNFSANDTAYTYDPLGNRLSETVTDTTTGEARTRGWTYNAAGLVATATEPNGAVTAYSYDSAGNPTQSTDALGRTTTYAHDAAGRLTQQTDPTGIVSAYTYDLRGRLLTQSRGGLLTSSTYTPTGLVSRIAYPNGYAVDYVYDAAHRLTGWRDNRAASGSFTLDGMGYRTAEETLDAQGALAWQVARSINQINRVASETQGADQTVRYTYDANGERISETNALGQTTQYGLDGLRRVQQITDSLGAQATLAYDPRDNVVTAADFKGVPTTYTRDAQGSATQETSADIGALATTYDALGLPQKIVDALGRATEITRDALGRPTRIQYADGTASVLRYDLAGTDYAEADAPKAGIGFLGELQDPGVTTRLRRDALGRVTRKQQVLAGGGTRSVGYAYVAAGAPGSAPTPGAGQIASITYPSGGVLSHVYDATGQLTGLTWNNTPLVNNLAWNPLGQPRAWQWPFVSTPGATGGLAASRIYNTAGQLVQYELGSYTWDAAGRVASLTQQLMLPTASGVAPTTFTTGFTYDGAGRIIGMAHEPRTVASLPGEVPLSAVVGPQQIGMAYDANGNRQSVVYTQGASDSGLTLQRTYSVAPDSNRLTGYAQTLSLGTGDPTVTQVPFSYDATGSITQAGQDLWGYGADGRLQSVQRSGGSDPAASATYLHNALNQRVLKTNGLRTPALRTETVYAEGPYEGSTVLGQYRGAADGSTSSTGTTEFIYLPTASGPMPITVVIDGRLYAVHSDHLNTPRRLTRDDGQVAWQWVTTAFGEVPPSTSATDFVQDAAMTSSAAAPSSSAAAPLVFDLRYPGQVADEESGLYYNLNRSYHPATGRYTQNDPIGLAGGWNRFAYVGGNPLSFVDSRGLYTEVVVWQGVGIGSSSFGHVSTNVNGKNFSWGPGGWDKQSATAAEYNKRQQDFRGGEGVMLNLNPQQEAALASCMTAQTAAYNAVSNNCGNPVQQCLDAVGAGIGDSVMPSSILENLHSSPNANGNVSYPSPRPSTGFGQGLLWR